MKRFFLLILPLSFGILLAGCDSSNPDADAPEPLASEIFEIETDVFGPAGKSQILTNHAVAATRVGFVSLVVKANLVLPYLLTAATLNANPESDGDGWTWTVSGVDVAQNDFSLSLRAEPTNGGFDWTMTVSGTAGEDTYDDFVLYTASSNANGSVGAWSLYLPQSGVRTNVLNANFTKPSASEASLEFSVPSGSNAGDSVIYTAAGSARTFTYTDVSDSKTTFVSWDAVTKAGYIKADDYNGGIEACWDSNFDNTTCQF